MIGSRKVRFNALRNLKFVVQNSMAFMKTNYSLTLFSILVVTNQTKITGAEMMYAPPTFNLLL